VTCAAK